MPSTPRAAIVRYDAGAGPAAGLRGADGAVRHLAGSVATLLRLDRRGLRERLAAPGDVVPQARLLPPVDGATEVWAAGVTYERSRDARVEESERASTVYEQVYDADRPELFFKAAAWRVAGDGEPIAIRADSQVDVPEPELAVVINSGGEIVGYTICDDVSSRSIEGENPLYLPQAKIYLGSCAVGPWIVPAPDLGDPYALAIRLAIHRGGAAAWSGETSTALLHRKLDDLAGYLYRADAFPDGAILSTGTCLVPDLPFTLAAGDVVEIEIDGIGRLANPVVRGPGGMRYLTERQQAREIR
ncbi:MAG: fumarylacetoacetate hydrolase family protein [Mycobacteriales bacterium]